MSDEREKMLSGQAYLPMDIALVSARMRARQLCRRFNDCAPENAGDRQQILKKLLGTMGRSVFIEAPFYCDYGSQIHLGDRVFFNFNCTVIDAGEVRIGNDFMCGPNVQFYTAQHPINPEARRTLEETAAPITVGNDVWIGGGAIICPGVSIGNKAVIGAGSVVTRDVPAGVVAVGNPCRVLRPVSGE